MSLNFWKKKLQFLEKAMTKRAQLIPTLPTLLAHLPASVVVQNCKKKRNIKNPEGNFGVLFFSSPQSNKKPLRTVE